MKYLFLLAMPVMLVFACNNSDSSGPGNQATAQVPTVTEPVKTDSSISGCYAYEGPKDTVVLQLANEGSNLVGPLTYNLFEKDRNDGTFQATVSGDTITGFYLFRSEGIMSVRQEIWKISNGKLLPGSGETIQRNDSVFFKDPAAIKFDETRALVKRPCTT